MHEDTLNYDHVCNIFMGSIRFNILNSILKIERTWKLEAPRGFPKEADDANEAGHLVALDCVT